MPRWRPGAPMTDARLQCGEGVDGRMPEVACDMHGRDINTRTQLFVCYLIDRALLGRARVIDR